MTKAVPDDSAVFFRIMACLSICFTPVVWAYGHTEVGVRAGVVGIVSLLYWSRNDYSWLRYADMALVQWALWSSVAHAFRCCADTWMMSVYLSLLTMSIMSFGCSMWIRHVRENEHGSAVMHACVHYLAMLSNVALCTCVADGFCAPRSCPNKT